MSNTNTLCNKIARYIKGKDANKPYLLSDVFCQDATLKMMVNSENVDFPSEVSGLDQITKTLSSEFNVKYENIYTFCFLDTLTQSDSLVNCQWLVAMTNKETKEVSVGYGDYHWTFDLDRETKVEKLIIIIEDMILLSKEHTNEILNWVSASTYPWAISTKFFDQVPKIDALSNLIHALSPKT